MSINDSLETFDPYEGEGDAGIVENIPGAVITHDAGGFHVTLPIIFGQVTAHGQTVTDACSNALVLQNRANDNFRNTVVA